MGKCFVSKREKVNLVLDQKDSASKKRTVKGRLGFRKIVKKENECAATLDLLNSKLKEASPKESRGEESQLRRKMAHPKLKRKGLAFAALDIPSSPKQENAEDDSFRIIERFKQSKDILLKEQELGRSFPQVRINRLRAREPVPRASISDAAFRQRFQRYIEEKYHLGELHVIGSGACSNVFRIAFEGNVYALKILKPFVVARVIYPREDILAPNLPKHPNFVSTYFVTKVSFPAQKDMLLPCFVMEYVEGLSLNDYLRSRDLCSGGKILSSELHLRLKDKKIKFNLALQTIKKSWGLIRTLIVDATHALVHLHKQRILHRDIKPESLLLYPCPDGNVVFKLGDLGISRDPNTEKGIPPAFDSGAIEYQGRLTPIGTPAYFSPEQVQTNVLFPKDGKVGALYSYPSDIWALAVTIYIAAVDKHPFKENYTQNLKEGLPLPEVYYPDEMPKALVDLLNRCFTLNPEKRLNGEQILKHRFLTDIDGVAREYLESLGY